MQNRGSAKLQPRFFLKIILIIAIILGGVYWDNQLLIVIKPQLGGKTITFAVEPENEWHFSWRHSVHKTLVKEYFRVQGENKFQLFLVKYESYGVGMPFLPSEGQLIEKDGQFELHMTRQFSVIPVGVGQEAQLELWHGAKSIMLYQEYQPGTFLQITAQKRYKFYLNYLL